MAHSANKVLTLLLVGMVREVIGQNVMPFNPEFSYNYLSRSAQFDQNKLSEEDAAQMGRGAEEDMGNIMSSAPIKIFRGPSPEQFNQIPMSGASGMIDTHGRSSEGPGTGYDLYNPSSQLVYSPADTIVCFEYVTQPEFHQGRGTQERSVSLRTIPLSPLPTVLPSLGLPLVPSLLPILQSLIPQNRGLLGPQILRVPPVRTTPLLPTYLGRNLLTPPLTTTGIKPTLPKINLRPLRSSYTPNSFRNNLEPLIFYA